MHITHAQKLPHYKKLHLFDSIFYPDLLVELQRRRIPEYLAAKYLKQIHVQDKQQPDCKRHGFAFLNDRGGYEVSIPDKEQPFEFTLSANAPTTFKAVNSNKLFVFESGWDFLSWLALQDKREPEHNIAILNTLFFCDPITKAILGMKDEINTVVLFMSNSEAGQQAAQYMDKQLTDADFTTRIMNSMYQGYKSLADYWCNDPHARRITGRKDVRALMQRTPAQ